MIFCAQCCNKYKFHVKQDTYHFSAYIVSKNKKNMNIYIINQTSWICFVRNGIYYDKSNFSDTFRMKCDEVYIYVCAKQGSSILVK